MSQTRGDVIFVGRNLESCKIVHSYLFEKLSKTVKKWWRGRVLIQGEKREIFIYNLLSKQIDTTLEKLFYEYKKSNVRVLQRKNGNIVVAQQNIFYMYMVSEFDINTGELMHNYGYHSATHNRPLSLFELDNGCIAILEEDIKVMNASGVVTEKNKVNCTKAIKLQDGTFIVAQPHAILVHYDATLENILQQITMNCEGGLGEFSDGIIMRSNRAYNIESYSLATNIKDQIMSVVGGIVSDIISLQDHCFVYIRDTNTTRYNSTFGRVRMLYNRGRTHFLSSRGLDRNKKDEEYDWSLNVGDGRVMFKNDNSIVVYNPLGKMEQNFEMDFKEWQLLLPVME
jgi:hypothetical protein